MRLKSLLVFISIFLLAISGQVFGVGEKYMVLAPGQIWTAGVGPTGTPIPQVGGVPFNVSVIATDSTGLNALAASDFNVTMTCDVISTILPANTFTLNQNGISLRYPVSVSFDPAVTGPVVVAANPSGSGPSSGSVTINSQVLNKFTFAPIANQTAGTTFTISVSAQTAGDNPVTGFNGTAQLTANYPSLAPVSLGTITFVNGVYSGSVTLNVASEGDVTLICASTIPSVTSNSAGFKVSAAALDRLVIIGPGQTFAPGVVPGNGRLSGTTLTAQQKAGSFFYVTVYAVDAYYNTSTTLTSISMSTTDPNFVFTPPGASPTDGNGSAIFQVELRTVASGLQTLTASSSVSGVTTGQDFVPMTFNDMNHFIFTQPISSPQFASVQFNVKVAAVDAYNNTVTTFSSTPTVSFFSDGIQLGSNYCWNSAISFSGGLANFNAKVYQMALNATIELSGYTGISNPFVVSPAAFKKLIFVAPGQTRDAGNKNKLGVSGNPSSTIAGSTISIDVFATDDYGNLISSVNDTVALTTIDTIASINSSTPPGSVLLSGGRATFNITFRTGGTMSVTGADGAIITKAVSSIVVQPTGLSYFEISNVPGTRSSSQTFLPVIKAKDQYGNTKINYVGTVYLSANTDYILPYESTMAITGTNTSASSYKWAVGFTLSDTGVKTLDSCVFHRSTTYTAQIFASDTFADVPENHVGITGISSGCIVNSGAADRLQVLPPGMQARPGTLDGENNTPTGQAMGTAFTCSVNITDNWWNIVPGNTNQLNITTNDTPHSNINLSNSLPQTVTLINGSATFTATYNIESSSFWIIATDATVLSITQDNSPNISIYNIYSFSINAVGGVNPIPNQTAAVPFNIQITAYSAYGIPATSFTGTVNLSSSTDYESNSTISVQTSANFTAGVLVMPMTMYMAKTDGGGVILSATYASIDYPSNSFFVNCGPSVHVLVLADGMTLKPGWAHDFIFGYAGYGGNPKTVKAGDASGLKVYYTDQDYNWVHNASGYARLTSTDPLASVDGMPLVSTNVYVTITAGVFTSSNMVLRHVGTTGIETITAASGGAEGSNTTPSINVKHAENTHFGVMAPGGPIIAGTSFNITIQALDNFQNICNKLNGDPVDGFNSPVNLTTNKGTNTMWPPSYPLLDGEAVASVQLFYAPDTTTRIIAGVSPVSGTSDIIIVDPNEFKRLLIMPPTGMNRKNGVYTSAPPTEFTMYDTSIPPFVTPYNSVTVNDAGHNPLGDIFTVYSCDAYGNITNTPDVIGQTLTVTTNDIYAQPVTLTTIDSASGQAIVNMIFRTAALGMHVSASITNPQVESFTTPDFTTTAGDTYGLQLLVPGYVVQNGSGFYDSAALGWFNGVSATALTEYSGTYFPVTVQTCDFFGNFTNDKSDLIRVNATAGEFSGSFPRSKTSFFGTLGYPVAGMLTFTAQLISGGDVDIPMTVLDLTTPALSPVWNYDPIITVTNGGNLEYRVFASPNTYTAYTAYGDSTKSINATADPDKFSFKVSVVDSVSGGIVNGVSNNFVCEPVAVPNFNVTLGGTLGISNGFTSNGIFVTDNQSYTNANTFRIKVTDLNTGADRIKLSGLSPKIIMGANPNSVTLTVGVHTASGFLTDIFNVKAGNNTLITGHLVDGNGNNLNGPVVSFSVLTGSGAFVAPSGVTGSTQNTSIDTVNGDAVVNFYGGYMNENCLIRASYNGYYDYVTIAVSVVDPVLGKVSNYPNPFKAGTESTNISYLLDSNSDVKIRIYTLFGDSVFSKDITSGQLGAVGGVVNNFVWDGKNSKGGVVGNGGYICAVEAVINGAKKNMIRKIAVAK